MSKSADAFRTIGEVADWLGVPAHVLRFWESKFAQVKPVKRAGGRRYYRPGDMQLLGGIRKLLHEDGMTIKGVQKVIREQGVRHVAAMSPLLDSELQAADAGIALDVPEQTEAPRGEVVHFTRKQSTTTVPIEPEPVDEVTDAPTDTVPDQPRIIPIDTPDDPSDTALARPSTLSALARGKRPVAPFDSARIADIVSRLADLRTHWASRS